MLRYFVTVALAGVLASPAIAQTTTVILVRHAEAVQADPNDRNPELAAEGKVRAAELARVLAESGISAVYSTPLHRTRETARPIADALGLAITETDVATGFVEAMAETLRGHGGETVLVVSHSNTVPAIINALGGGPFEQLGHDEYDDLFVVTLTPAGVSTVRLKYGGPTP